MKLHYIQRNFGMSCGKPTKPHSRTEYIKQQLSLHNINLFALFYTFICIHIHTNNTNAFILF